MANVKPRVIPSIAKMETITETTRSASLLSVNITVAFSAFENVSFDNHIRKKIEINFGSVRAQSRGFSSRNVTPAQLVPGPRISDGTHREEIEGHCPFLARCGTERWDISG